ncbi:AAA family ATPase [Corynebacterium terpenotabidum]|uniref:DNA primase/polymerase bifunctional N-terminal domain-containing protein n=1 Tax=Corynebacterium terpenotabidum Y-11 TaxID=1200352 RepID=S4XES8_9CORY|nr:AAA family ATPase [Corynebacterium terpenotabidum]AGP30115.1 hypothetical protein A606_02310 [Corynebacterium terpenotabidum Y-11]
MDDTYIQSLTVEAEQYANTTPAQHLPSAVFAQLVDQALSAPTALDAARIWISLGIGVVGVDQFKRPVNKQRYGASDAPMTTAEQVTQAWTKNPAMGIAIVPGGKRLLGIDIDNGYETEWLRSWGQTRGLYVEDMTVETPGLSGVAAHTGGGHLYIVMPDGWADGYSLPKKQTVVDEQGAISDSSFDAPASFLVSISGQYMLVPPTSREGRSYRHTGSPVIADVYLTQDLLGVLDQTAAEDARREAEVRRQQGILDRQARRAEQGDAYVPDLADRIQDWEDQRRWVDVFSDLPEFYLDGVSSCGCDVWVWSGSSTRTRSLVAHEGCSEMAGSRVCTVFSGSLLTHLKDVLPAEHQPSRSSFNMTQMVCALVYGGDWEEFLRGEGIHRDVDGSSQISEEQAVTTFMNLLASAPVPSTDEQSAEAVVPEPQWDMNEILEKIQEFGIPSLTDEQRIFLRDRAETLTGLTGSVIRMLLEDPTGAGALPMGDVMTAVKNRSVADLVKEAASTTTEAPFSPLEMDSALYQDESEFWGETFRVSPTPAYLDMFYSSGSHALVGESGIGKTWLAVAAAADVLFRHVLTPADRPSAKPGSVVYIDIDGNTEGKLRQRALMLGIAPIDIYTRAFWVVSPTKIASEQRISTEKAMERIISYLEENPPKMVILDSTQKAMAAMGLDMNSGTDFSTLTLKMDRFLSKGQTSLIYLDHTGNGVDAQNRAMGSSQKKAQIDTTFIMKKVKPAKDEDGKEKYQDTVIAVDLDITKDRHHGVEDALVIPEEPGYAGRLIINPSRLGGGVQKVEVAGHSLDHLETRLRTSAQVHGGREGREQDRLKEIAQGLATWLAEQGEPVKKGNLIAAAQEIFPTYLKSDKSVRAFLGSDVAQEFIRSEKRGTSELWSAR